jgi:hypothetical protein
VHESAVLPSRAIVGDIEKIELSEWFSRWLLSQELSGSQARFVLSTADAALFVERMIPHIAGIKDATS